MPNRPSEPPRGWLRLIAAMVYVRQVYDLAPRPLQLLVWIVPLWLAHRLGLGTAWITFR
jgi:hypothetical protein